MGTLVNNYIFKALDNYPYYLDEVMESLNYALSYDNKNTMALTLMGKVHAEKLHKYDEAIGYYKQALAENIHAFEVYAPYINALLWNEDYKEAADFIDFAISIKGSDKGILFLKKAILYEQTKKYKKALTFIKLAKKNTYNSEFMETINEEKQRIKAKISKKKKVKSSKKDKKRKKKKK